MKKLLALAVVSGLLVLGAAGCASTEVDEEGCVGAACETDPNFIGGIPEEEEEVPVEQEEQPPVEMPYVELPAASDVEKVLGLQQFVIKVPNHGTGVNQDDLVTEDELTPEEKVKIETLRTAVDQGLVLGQDHYLEAISISLQKMGIAADYEGIVTDGFADLTATPEECPFAKYYDNGFTPTGVTCDYLVDLAKVEVYSKLADLVDKNPLPAEIASSEYATEAHFWYEQGTMSGIDEERVLVRGDLKAKQLCNTKPTPPESSYEKGVIVGRQLFAKKFNEWLAQTGHTPDYPTMSQKIQVCNANTAMLEPARMAALQAVSAEATAEPLCPDSYAPPSQEGQLQYSQAKIDYEDGISAGVQAEFALAAVVVFKVIPCNVSDPLVVDLDGDGLELVPIHEGVNFDLYGTGAKAVSWVSTHDGFLVMDRNGNGRIDSGAEMFGNLDGRYADGFAQLAELDQDLDGTVSPQEASLLVWRDANANGVTDSGELLPVDFSVPATAGQVSMVSGGNRIPKVAYAGSVLVGDALLHDAPHARLR